VTSRTQRLARTSGATFAVAVVAAAVGLAVLPSGSGNRGGAAFAQSADPLGISLTPNALATDGDGNLYIGDHANHVVRQVTPDGAASVVVAGTGTEGVPAPGPATSVQLINPTGLVVGEDGVLYIADAGASAVLAVDEGEASVVAGQPQAIDGPPVPPPLPGSATSAALLSPSGLGLDEDGNLYTALAWHAVVVKITPAGALSIVAGVPATFGRPSPDGPATRSKLFLPRDLTVDVLGNVLIADSENFVVSKVDADGVLSIVAGSGYQGEPWPGGEAIESDLGFIAGVAADAAGNVYFSDPEHDLVMKVDTNGELSVVAGSGETGPPTPGPATASALGDPGALAVDGDGNLFIGDVSNHVVLKVDVNGVLSVFAGNGQKSPAATPTITNLPGSAEPGGDFVAEIATNSDGVRSAVSSTPDVCTTTESTELGVPVALLAEGQCTLTASVGAGTSWLAGEGEPQSFAVGSELLCAGEPVTVDLGDGQQPTAEPDVIWGTPGPDVVQGGGGDDVFCARGGADTFDGGRGADRAFGSPGRDVLRGGLGADVLQGGIGADRLLGQQDVDVLRGARGRDHLDGGPGTDDLDGGPQRDVCRLDPGRDSSASCEVR
jgi:sugar lactone lactonase YvrE